MIDASPPTSYPEERKALLRAAEVMATTANGLIAAAERFETFTDAQRARLVECAREYLANMPELKP